MLPLGTANDLARTLGIPEDLEAAADVIAEGALRTIDVGSVNGHPFFNVASIGLSVDLARSLTPELKRRWGRAGYALAAMRVLARARRFSAWISEGDETTRVKSLQIAVGNGRHYGGGNVIEADAEIDDGHLDLYSLEMNDVWKLALGLRTFRSGAHGAWTDVRTARGVEFDIATRTPRGGERRRRDRHADAGALSRASRGGARVRARDAAGGLARRSGRGEPRHLVAAVAVGLVRRMAAAAQEGLLDPLYVAPGAALDLDPAGDRQRTVRERPDRDRPGQLGQGERRGPRRRLPVATNPPSMCELSQNGLFLERPQRQSVARVIAPAPAMARSAWTASGPFSRITRMFTKGGDSGAPPSWRTTLIAPEGQASAMRINIPAVTASGASQGPSTFALNAAGAPVTQRRAWMQRLPSKVTVAAAPSAISTDMDVSRCRWGEAYHAWGVAQNAH